MASSAANREAHVHLVEQLRSKLAEAALGGPERARARHVERGKLLPRDRVDGLLDPGSPLLWRVSFATAAVVGLVNTWPLLALDRAAPRGLFRRFRWLVAVLYATILALAVVPTLSAPTGQPPLQLVALALILLVVLAHGLAWEFMMEPDQRPGAASH